MAGGMPMSFTETVQQSGQLLDHIKNHPIDWNLAITWIVIVAVGCWLWAEFIELLESRRMRRRFSRPQMADQQQAIEECSLTCDGRWSKTRCLLPTIAGHLRLEGRMMIFGG